MQSELHRELVYSRIKCSEREYVQHRLAKRADLVAELLRGDNTDVYICGLLGLEDGVERALDEISRTHEIAWPSLRRELRNNGRFHIETY